MMFAPVVTRFITYSMPMPRFALPYMQAVISHPHMQDWIGGAQEEDMVIEKFEGPAQGGIVRAPASPDSPRHPSCAAAPCGAAAWLIV